MRIVVDGTSVEARVVDGTSVEARRRASADVAGGRSPGITAGSMAGGAQDPAAGRALRAWAATFPLGDRDADTNGCKVGGAQS